MSEQTKKRRAVKKAKPRRYYMHTINSRPAYWSDISEQIVFADVVTDRLYGQRDSVVLRTSLRQIRRDQQRTIENRKAWGMSEPAGRYGYALVSLPLEGADDGE